MKRVKAACICQTLHFMLKDDIEHDYAVQLVNEEVAHYKAKLEHDRTKFKIINAYKLYCHRVRVDTLLECRCLNCLKQ